MSTPPSTIELRARLVTLAAHAQDVPPERRVQFVSLLERLERLASDEPQVWAF